MRRAYVPVAIERCEFGTGRCGPELWCHARLRQAVHPGESLIFDLEIVNGRGMCVGTVSGLHVRAASPELLVGEKEWHRWLYQVSWQLRERRPPTADSFLSPEEVARRVRAEWTGGAAAPSLEGYTEAFEGLERLAVDYIRWNLRSMGRDFEPGARWGEAQLREGLQVIPRHARLLHRLLDILAEAGIVARGPGGWVVVDRPGNGSLQLTHAALVAEHGDRIAAELALLGRSGPRLADVLRGHADPLELLFPDGDLSLTSRVYERSPLQHWINDRIGGLVAAAVGDLGAGRSIRLIEIGAGTGATTNSILPGLPPDRTTYLFTDVSPLFTRKAAEKFAAHPWVTYAVLDIEKPPEEQGIRAGQFDIVIAANVLHATRNLGETLSHVRELLCPGGLLILLEVTSRQRWADLTFGLLEGWWRFEDDGWRADHPLLSVERWKELLPAHGFDPVEPLTIDFRADGAVAEDIGPISCQYTVFTAQKSVSAAAQAPWLLLCDEKGVGSALADVLHRRGLDAILATPGEVFHRHDRATYTLATTPADAERLLDAAGTLSGIVHLWSLDCPATWPSSEEMKQAVRWVCESPLSILQAAIRRGSPPPIWLVTEGAQDVNGSGGRPESTSGLPRSAVWGMARAINEEHPDVPIVRLDVDLTACDAATAALLIDSELFSSEPEAEIAFRGDSRYVARLAPYRAGTPAHRSRPLVFRGDGYYLITGGLGGLGLQLARWMVERGARHLALASRSRPGAAEEEALAGMARGDVHIRIIQVNVTDAEALARVVSDLHDNGPLRGVIHAAGVLDDGVLMHQTWERFERVLGPKVWGAWNLHRATERIPLDFFILFSSATSLLGNAGQANHAAANAFLDGLSHFRRARSLPAQSLNWGAWATVGAAALRKVDDHLEKKGLGTMRPPDALDALEALIAADPIQVGIVPINWTKFLNRPLNPAMRPFFSQVRASERSLPTGSPIAPTGAGLGDELAAAPPKRRRDLLHRFVCQTVEAVLGVGSGESVDPMLGFFDLGMDSLLSLDLRNRLQAGLGASCPPP